MEPFANPRTQTSGILTPSQKSSFNHQRPNTMLTPDVKRAKTLAAIDSKAVLAYPTTITIPSKHVIKALYEASIEGSERASGRKYDYEDNYNDQQHLAPAGILSFEKVLLPAVGFEEENVLKRVQSKLQRDTPRYKFLMEDCRKLIRKSIHNAMEAVQASRSIRFNCQMQRKNERLQEAKKAREMQQRARKEEQDRLAKERRRRKEILRIEKKRHLGRNYSRNQELWKEIVFLTSSAALLEREDRMWIQIEKDIERLEDDQFNFSDRGHSNDDLDQQIINATSSLSLSSVILLHTQKCRLENEAEDVVKDIILTSSRIQKGLEMILKILKESEISRKGLFEKYKNDHFFRGYQSVRNPKTMIRFLSQSQDDHV